MPECRVVLRNCGVIDPAKIESYLARDGFQALRKARQLPPAQVIEEVKKSGLRGRGGAGFPVGMKWELASKSPGKQRFVVCNADEGEVGTFKDRYVLRNDPFSLFEGIAIAAYAIGASRAYLYVRAEYHYLFDHLSRALKQAMSEGLGCEIELREGAGAYICGEESSLMESIEGNRGEVRYRPPFPPNHGLWQEPTTINNVETLMNIVPIILTGAEQYCRVGTEQSKGTKVFSVTGDVERPAVYEVPLGTPLRELVEGLAGGHDVKAVQVGGASGRVVPASRLDTPLAFETILGAGAIMVFNNSRSMVELARQNIEFFAEESCGKCVPCREGNQVLLYLLTRIGQGTGKTSDLAILNELSETMMLSSLCGLGQAAPNSVVDTLEHFGAEYKSLVHA
ncbi:MAG: NADH-ubiquinone oxidoreductase-F iron-sulfur binding region domain-containing protein [Dehalococcoidia bacterium]|nr:NADH-ubiquinone oxidoreductase-F iron-sulfur binding region domain-containing protein [Dehalococcoidia bacterium]